MSILSTFVREGLSCPVPVALCAPPLALNAFSRRLISPVFPQPPHLLSASVNVIAPIRRERGGFYAAAFLGAGLLLGASLASGAPGSGGAGAGYGEAGGAGGGYSGVFANQTAGPSGGNGGDGYNYVNNAVNAAKGGIVGTSVATDLSVTQSISGGDGADGVAGNSAQFHGSSGGGGGGGIFASSAITITVNQSVQVIGGNGGAGAGARPGSTQSNAGGGGGGGSGVIFSDGGKLVNDGGLIKGGEGGNGASRWGSAESATGGGGGGAGVQGANVTIINSGTISGGAGGKGGTAYVSAGNGEQGAAINWTGGNSNRLQMDTGSVIDGAIWVQAGASADIVANTQGLVMANAFVFDGLGTLDTQANNLTIDGIVSGNGSLEKTGSGVLTLTNTNSYLGGTTVRGGTISTSADGNLGAASSKLTLDGGTVNATRSYTMTRDVLLGSAGGAFSTEADTTLTIDGAISDALAGSAGQLTKTGLGTLILNGANTYSGATNVAAGTLLAGAANTLTANSVYSVQSGANLDLNGHDQTIAGMNNSGLVNLLGDVPGTTLAVTGVWHGSGGVLRLGVVLDDSTSISDRLVLDGAAAKVTGATHIQVVNLDGLGALTEGDGIEVVSAINGATSTAQSSADGFRLVGGHVDAGAYEYRLFAADANGAGESWYLRSSLPMPGSDAPAYRRETLLYGALPEQFRQANQAMLGTLFQRAGSAQPDGAEQRQAWGRVISAQRTINQSGPLNPTSEGRFNGFQVGSDLWANGDWRAGAYIGQLDGDMSVSGAYAGAADKQVGSNDLKNNYVGGYGTWRNSSRAYADVVLQKGFHRYSAKSSGSAATRGKGESLSASIEAGQAFPVGSGWHVEPQLQLMVQQLDMDDVRIPGAQVRQDTPASWLGRAGLRVASEPTATGRMLQPYTQVNLYKGSGSADVGHYIGPAGSARIKTSGAHSGAELAVGANLHLSPTYVIYAELSQRGAFDDKTEIKGSTSGTVGMSLRW